MRDVTIIGAGPAGCVAAIVLARRGWAVMLLEQHRFPRDKVCGECLSDIGMRVLDRLGLRGELEAQGAVKLTHSLIHSAHGNTLRTDLQKPMWGLSRRRFDNLLLDAARQSGATVRQPVRCERLEQAPAPLLRLRDLESNVVEELRPSVVIVADGKAALGGSAPAQTGDFGIKAHFVGVDGPRDAIELFGVRGSYGGLAPIEDGQWNAAFSVPAERLRAHGGDVGALFARIVDENPVLAGRLAGATRVGPWLAAPLPRFGVRRCCDADVVPVGNAVAALEPIGGEGMGLAMRSAELAAQEMDTSQGDWNARTMRRLRHHYARLWGIRRVACRAGGLGVSNARLTRTLFPMLSRFPGPLKAMARLMGK